MLLWQTHERMQAQACRYLARLAKRGDAFSVEMIEAGAVPSVVEIMEANDGSVDVQIEVWDHATHWMNVPQ